MPSVAEGGAGVVRSLHGASSVLPTGHVCRASVCSTAHRNECPVALQVLGLRAVAG